MAEAIFIEIGMIIIIATLISALIRLLKQPLIIGYILSGIVVGPFILNLVKASETIAAFSQIGIAFLLFIVGLHLSPKVIKEVGKISLITGLGQIIFTSLIGYFIGIMLGFSVITALYIAIALTFSSTIIIMKLLSDKDALEKLYGKISIGFLLVQDLVAIIILIIISSITTEGEISSTLILTLLRGGIIVGILIPVSYYVLPKLSDFFAKSQEFLFLFSISWGFGLSLLFLYAGLSIEVGALIAGIMLSMSPYSYEISSKLKSLRDFFIISFFIVLGSQMAFGDISSLIIPAVLFSLFVLIGNPLIVMILMGLLGYSKKTGFMAGLAVAQISEFSLILIALGVKTGSLTQDILSFVTLIGLITIAGSTYMIIYSEQIYEKLSNILTIFEKKRIKEKNLLKKDYKYILIGYNRIGFSIIRAFSGITRNFLVIDFNPDVIKSLKSRGIHALYGDVDDSNLLEETRLSKALVIVSTVPEKETNHLLLRVLKSKDSKNNKKKHKPVIILTARQISDALEMYRNGADYVILPHFLGGEYTAKLLSNAKGNKKAYKRERDREIKILSERLREGHEHPKIAKNC